MEGPQAMIDTRKLERDLYIRLIGSSVVSTGLQYLAFFVRPQVWDFSIAPSRVVVFACMAFAVYTAFGMTAAFFISRGIMRRTTRWLDEGGPPSPLEARRVWRIPYMYATWSLFFWLGAMIFAPVVANLWWFDEGRLPLVRLELSLLLGGFLAFWFGYLLIEMRLREVFAIASRGGAPHVTRASSLSTRLAFLWGAGAVAPVVSISLVLIGLSPEKTYIARVTVWALCAAAFVMSGLFTLVAVRRITRDVMGVQRAMGRVAEGDLDMTIGVDNPSELGQLQAGFNAMVVGLRERRTLEDLFGRHVGSEVAQRAVEKGTELGGEHREASVLFVDVVGSSRLAQTMRAEEVVELLNAFFEAVVTALASHGGWINKFEGDGAVGIFGAPADQPDHAARALRAGRELRSKLDALERDNPQLRAAIGISSGEVVAGNVGARERYEYTIIGDPVNEASRITDEAKTRSCRLLASASAVATSGDESPNWQSVGEVQLRGREGGSELFAPYA
jgi:adenylate cyclase